MLRRAIYLGLFVLLVHICESHKTPWGRPRPSGGCRNTTTSIISYSKSVCIRRSWYFRCTERRLVTQYKQKVNRSCCEGWTGRFCTIPLCDPACPSGQFCTGPNTCGGCNGSNCEGSHFCPRPETFRVRTRSWWCFWRCWSYGSRMNSRACCPGWVGPDCDQRATSTQGTTPSSSQTPESDLSSTPKQNPEPTPARTTPSSTSGRFPEPTPTPTPAAASTSKLPLCDDVCDPGRDCVTNCVTKKTIDP